ncbi:MAG: hypothetical protein AB7E51_12690 [Pseudodesulfovibrio sp.]|jgi:hypothetical protein|uniref:hypothetical protein n=1 Tax=Pseudodesulfovibrio sp. TaxID=2035812 RepID=UPI003D0D81C2
MFASTSKTVSSDAVAACVPFAGLGHATAAVEAVARSYRPGRQAPPVVARRPVRAAGPHGYGLQCRLCRETRAG